ncbi:MAG: hypothetical protein AAFQ29_03060 [Pseudomonadota bacterium]
MLYNVRTRGWWRMVKLLTKIIFLIVLAAAVLSLTSCVGGPSRADVTKLIADFYEQNPPTCIVKFSVGIPEEGDGDHLYFPVIFRIQEEKQVQEQILINRREKKWVLSKGAIESLSKISLLHC